MANVHVAISVNQPTVAIGFATKEPAFIGRPIRPRLLTSALANVAANDPLAGIARSILDHDIVAKLCLIFTRVRLHIKVIVAVLLSLERYEAVIITILELLLLVLVDILRVRPVLVESLL